MNKILKKYIWIAEGLVMVATLIFSIFDLRLMSALRLTRPTLQLQNGALQKRRCSRG